MLNENLKNTGKNKERLGACGPTGHISVLLLEHLSHSIKLRQTPLGHTVLTSTCLQDCSQSVFVNEKTALFISNGAEAIFFITAYPCRTQLWLFNPQHSQCDDASS